MKGIVYGNTFERADKQLEKIIKEYDLVNIQKLSERKNQRRHEIVYANGDYWEALSACESCRGKSCNIAYIDGTIEKNLIVNVVNPTIKAMPYRAYHYYW